MLSLPSLTGWERAQARLGGAEPIPSLQILWKRLVAGDLIRFRPSRHRASACVKPSRLGPALRKGLGLEPSPSPWTGSREASLREAGPTGLSLLPKGGRDPGSA